MNMALREQGIESVHDQVVSFVAQRWAKAFVCKVTIKTSMEQNPWADPNQQCDIVGWYVSSGGNTVEWMAEVETEESLNDPQNVGRWKRMMTRGVPFYLLVPRGFRESSQKQAQDSFIAFSCIYEYVFINGTCHVL